jgi:nitrate reductase NapD
MNLSGILVFVSPGAKDRAVDSLNALPGVEVHHVDDQGRVVVVQEAQSVTEEAAGLQRINALPEVVSAQLVYHYFAEDHDNVSLPPEELDQMAGLDPEILERLNS